MGKVITALVFWAVAWLLIGGLIQLDLNTDLLNLGKMGRGTIILGLLGVLPPLFAIAVILQSVKDSDAQSLFQRITSDTTYPPFGLYLRAFDYDVDAKTPGDDLGKITQAIDNIWKSDRSLSALVAHALKQNCGVEQVVAIMPPKGGGPLPMEVHHGAGLIQLGGVEWRHAAFQLMKKAKVVVLAAGPSPGVQWEFEQLRRLGRLRSTVVVIPPMSDDTAHGGEPERQRLLAWAWQLGLRVPVKASAGLALTFDQQSVVRAAHRLEISEKAERENASQLTSAPRYADEAAAKEAASEALAVDGDRFQIWRGSLIVPALRAADPYLRIRGDEVGPVALLLLECLFWGHVIHASQDALSARERADFNTSLPGKIASVNPSTMNQSASEIAMRIAGLVFEASNLVALTADTEVVQTPDLATRYIRATEHLIPRADRFAAFPRTHNAGDLWLSAAGEAGRRTLQGKFRKQ